MAAVWKLGECTVREAWELFPRHVAYTTIMTTLVRLFRKGLLFRKRKANRYLYSPRCTEPQWQGHAAKEAVDVFLTTPNVPRKLLISSLHKAISEQDK